MENPRLVSDLQYYLYKDNMKNQLILGESLEELKKINNDSINMVLCDLPYYSMNKCWDSQWKNEESYLQWVDSTLLEYQRILKDNSNLFIFTGRQYNRKIALLLDKYFIEKRIIIWARKRSFNNTRGKALSSGYEPICYYSKGDCAIFNNMKIKKESIRKEYTEGILKNGVNLSDVWDDIPALPHNSKEKVKHPTQKPIELLKRIILIGSTENDIILDNCMGSGSTGVACKILNRNFIGIEIYKKYYDIAKKRINQD